MLKNVEFRAIDKDPFKAEARVTLGDIQITGFKVLKNDKGELWVGAPSKAYPKKDGTTGYQSIVWWPDPAKRQAFQDEVLEAYERFQKGEKEQPAKPKEASGFRSRGSVPICS